MNLYCKKAGAAPVIWLGRVRRQIYGAIHIWFTRRGGKYPLLLQRLQPTQPQQLLDSIHCMNFDQPLLPVGVNAENLEAVLISFIILHMLL